MTNLDNVKNQMLDNFYEYLLENPDEVMVAGITLDVVTGAVELTADPTFTELFTVTIVSKG